MSTPLLMTPTRSEIRLETLGWRLYDEQNDPAETRNLADNPEHAPLLASLQKHLAPVGSDEAPPKSAPKPKATKSGSTDPNEPRDKRFDRLYPGKTQLTIDEYLTGQGSDQAAARERFTRQDQDKNGVVTREEFIGGGKGK